MNSVTKKTCPHCKKEFLTRDSSKVFCSLSCEDDYKNADKDKEILKNHKPGRPSNKPVKELKKCLGCGEPIVQKTKRVRKFCCDECRYQYHANLKKQQEKPLPTATCKNCGKEFTPKNINNVVFCSKRCNQIWHNHPDEHKTEVFDRASEEYKAFQREKIEKQLERTKFVCQICNKEFKAKGIGSKYCPECSTKLKAQRNHDRQINHRKAFEKMESLKSDIEAKIKASEEALAKSEKEQLQLKARVDTLYEIYNNLRETAA